ncbi:carbohydrate binding family 9 domain-containing protein [Flavobacterium sp. N2270]|uniref:carbohydrate binding family 9 domain-containing protein n=1 Tax=Flavobacterium sp. N2270 TaxID=2986831 RepID=UPI0022245A8D|nr:carbohydrate binding family 9 domain-containing protein [Flavobacterium sp. N2270]
MHKNLIFIFLLCFNSFKTQAQDNIISKKKLVATKINESIAIDGELNESIWNESKIASDFVMFEPDNGKPSPNELRTEVKILYNNDAVYIGAILYDNDPKAILKEITERDNFGISDSFGVYINGYNDGQQDFQFYVTASNGQADCNFTSQYGEDYSWNAIWESKAKVTNFGWIVEMRIPYAALRFPENKEQVWGINFFREVRRKRQKFTWSPINTQVATFSQQAGILEGISNINPPTRLFLIPYASGYVNSNKDNTELTLKGGLDIKYGINDAFTLDAILIPDFGQTKFDNVELNLGPFEQQFNENRPFFTEGTDLFSKGNLLYSRRIGAAPQFYPELADNEIINEFPSTVNLLNALKVSGRNSDGLGIGFLNAITEKTDVTIINPDENTSRKETVSPLTNYNVTVLDQRFNQNSSVTFINTNVTRNGSFRDANVTGLLFDLNTKKNTYNLSGDMKMSSVYDSENKNGINTSIYIAETSGKVRFSLGANYVSKDFDNNDLGINFQTNYTDFSSNVNYRILNPTKLFNTFRINLNSYMQYNNTTGRIQGNNFNINFSGNNKANHYMSASFGYNPFKNYDYYEPRQDGRFLIYPESYNGSLYLSTNYNNKFAVDINPYFTNVNEKDRYNYGIGFSPRYRFSDRFSLIYSFDLYKQFNNVGYIDNDDVSIYFAKRNRDTYTNSITSKYSINSNMNFNLSVRHYWSLAENNSFHTLNNDGTLTETTYTENKNSNFSTWNLDLSYSWWFAPGSQISVLYRNNASSFDRAINKDFSNNFSNLIGDNLNHVLSVSIRYYIDYNQAKNWLKKA